MNNEFQWRADEFDAVHIIAAQGEFEILGVDGDKVRLDADADNHHIGVPAPRIEGRWLIVNASFGHGEWVLELPRSKEWVLALSSGHGEVRVENVSGRFGIQLGNGEIQMQDCRGVFQLRSGSGDVELENCTQAPAPAAPPRYEGGESKSDRAADDSGAIPPTPPSPPFPPIPPIPPIGVRMQGKRVKVETGDEWDDYGRAWEVWGERFAERTSKWAENFARDLNIEFKFGWSDEVTQTDGLHIQLGSGDIQLQVVDAQNVSVRQGSGDVEIEDGRIGALSVETSRGDVQIEAVLPTDAWNVNTRHGDIQLNLPSDAYARLDVATRHGEIHCDAPLVKVGRPGPGTRHSNRMVGTVGQGEGEAVEVHLESQHGDIQIEVENRPSRYQGARGATTAVETARRAVSTRAPQPAPQTSNAVVPVTVTDLPQAPELTGSRQPVPTQVYHTQMEILQALQRGEITIAEAEMLLSSLNR